MSENALRHSAPRALSHSREVAVILGALAGIAALQLNLAFVKSVNWDEYFHFSQIHAFRQGLDVGLVQNPFVWLFNWVPNLGGQTIDNILIIRSLMLPFELLVIAGIVVCARQFSDRTTALLCGLVYASAGYAFTQGLALRADMIAASLLMTAAAVGFNARINLLTSLCIAGLCTLAFLASIKSLLYFPVVLAVLFHRRADLDTVLKHWPRVAGFVLIAALAAPLLLPSTTADILKLLEASALRMFGGGLFPQPQYLLKQLVLGPIFALLLGGFLFWMARSDASRDQKLVLVLLAAPALWPAIYLNSYPYFFAFVLPPVVVALAPAIGIARQRYGPVALSVALCLNALVLWAAEPRLPLSNQTELQDTSRKSFPVPVTYIDEAGFLGEYPRAVRHFSSGWALSNYRQRGVPTYKRQMLRETVPLLIANSFALQNVFRDRPTGDRLLAIDEQAIRDNFIQHRGLVFVAGKHLAAGEVRADAFFTTPGKYRVESAPIRISGEEYGVGDTVTVARKSYVLENRSTRDASLRWASAGNPAESLITLQNLYSDY